MPSERVPLQLMTDESSTVAPFSPRPTGTAAAAVTWSDLLKPNANVLVLGTMGAGKSYWPKATAGYTEIAGLVR